MSLDRARFDRRTVLAAALATGGGAVLAAASRGQGAGAAMAQYAARTKPAGSDLGAIEHVVFLMHENRSFDHYYGTYKGVRGFDDHPKGSCGNLRPGMARRARHDAAPLPSRHGLEHRRVHLRPRPQLVGPTHVLERRADGPVRHHAHRAGVRGPPERGPDHGLLHAGRTWTSTTRWPTPSPSCDGYHCSVMGPTHPNRLTALSGTLDPTGTAAGPVLITNEASQAIGSAYWETMPEVLEDAGVSGRSTTRRAPRTAAVTSNPAWLLSDNILLYFKPVPGPVVVALQEGLHPALPQRLRQRRRPTTPAAGRWIIPPIGYDEHPPSPPAVGDVVHPPGDRRPGLQPEGVVQDGAVHHVRRERRLLRPRATAGGAGGHPRRVPDGPTAARRTPTASPARSASASGCRCSCVSPFSRGGHVCSDMFDHTSQLRFLEDALRGEGTQHLGLAPPHGGRPDLDAAPEAQRPDRAQAAQHVEGPDGRRAGRGLHQHIGPGGGARQRHAELPGAGAPGDADAGDGLSRSVREVSA